MFRFIIALFLLMSASLANAQHYHRNHYHHHHHARSHWIAPVIIGGIVGYTIANTSRPEPVPSVVYVEQSGTNSFCPLGYRPIFNTVYVYDRWGRMIPQQQLLGCQ